MRAGRSRGAVRHRDGDRGPEASGRAAHHGRQPHARPGLFHLKQCIDHLPSPPLPSKKIQSDLLSSTTIISFLQVGQENASLEEQRAR